MFVISLCADLDMKINAILSIIVQDDGDSFAKRAEMYYQKRPELIEMVEELHKSYRSLAEKYDLLRSQLNNNDSHPRLLLSLSKSVRPKNDDVQGQDSISHSHSKSSTADEVHDETELDDDYSNGKLAEEFTLDYDKKKHMKKNINGNGNGNGNIAFQRNASDGSQAAMLEHEKMWSELRFKVSELVDENLSHQAELIRRNDEKRETIRSLCSKIDDDDKMDNVKKSHKVNSRKSQSQLSRLKRLFFGRFMKSNNAD